MPEMTLSPQFRQWLVGLRNEFHRHPELSGQETRTTRRICEELEALGIPAATFDDITGAFGLIRGSGRNPEAGTGKTIALRADIDAIPLTEAAGRPHGSCSPGIMHACGHDANTAIVLGVGRMIQESGLARRIPGNIKLIFQPSEEKLGGALSMIKRGVLKNPDVDRILAGHMDPNLEVGTVGVFNRIGHAASDPFELTVTGRGTHGARPHRGVNPITAGSAFAAQLDGIVQRLVSPAQSAVVSVGSFHAGEAGNVIPDTAVIKGSLRTHNASVRKTLIRAMTDLAAGIDAMFSTQSRLEFGPGAPLGSNDQGASQSLYRASCRVVGESGVNILPFIMGSDDFYFFTQKVPGAMMRFGCASKSDGMVHPLHSPDFDLPDKSLEIGVRILFSAVLDFFEP